MHQRVNATYREKVDFIVTSGFGLRMNNFEKGYLRHKNKGTWTIRYDDEPSKWYQYVASRGVDSSPKLATTEAHVLTTPKTTSLVAHAVENNDA
jgi:hypothetical protein